MADHRSSGKHEDLGPTATSALGDAYDNALRSLQRRGGDPLLRYSLARHLMAAAFAGELRPDLLRERGITYVTKWFEQSDSRGDFSCCWRAPAASWQTVTRIELGEILLAEAQKAVPAHTSYPGHVSVFALPELQELCANWTVQGFTLWTSDTEVCRQSLGAAERPLKYGYRVV